jgi:hypothetical protein
MNDKIIEINNKNLTIYKEKEEEINNLKDNN